MLDEWPRARVDRLTESYAIASWRRFVIWVVEGHTPLHELEHLRRLATEQLEQRAETNVTLIVLYDARTTMSMAERRSVARLMDETKHTRVASSTVVLARGLIGSLHRSILTGISFLAPPPHPVRICAEVSPAIDFLHPYIESVCGPIRSDQLLAMVSSLYGELCARKLAVDAS